MEIEAVREMDNLILREKWVVKVEILLARVREADNLIRRVKEKGLILQGQKVEKEQI